MSAEVLPRSLPSLNFCVILPCAVAFFAVLPYNRHRIVSFRRRVGAAGEPNSWEVIFLKNFAKPLCLVCAAALAASLAGCSFFKGDSASSEAASSSAQTVSVYGSASDFDYENFTYSDGLDENGYWTGIRALDYVTLPDDTASIPVERAQIEPSAEDVQAQVDSLLSQNAASVQVTNRAAADGDTVNIDYAGSVGGVAFTGGTSTGYDLTLGSGTFIDGFETQIVGHTPGETFDVTVTFPDNYGESTDAEGNTVTLSGQEAVFTVTLNYISETVLPELTDEWVDASYGESDGVHTVEELRAYFSELLYQDNLKSYILDYLLENSTFTELPKALTDYQVNQCLNYYYSLASYYGYTLDDFVQNVMGYDSIDVLLAEMDDSIDKYSKEALIYQAVAEQLDITPTQEQIDVYSAYVDAYGANYCRMVSVMDAVTETLLAGVQET